MMSSLYFCIKYMCKKTKQKYGNEGPIIIINEKENEMMSEIQKDSDMSAQVILKKIVMKKHPEIKSK